MTGGFRLSSDLPEREASPGHEDTKLHEEWSPGRLLKKPLSQRYSGYQIPPRSWWILHSQNLHPRLTHAPSRIPPTQRVCEKARSLGHRGSGQRGQATLPDLLSLRVVVAAYIAFSHTLAVGGIAGGSGFDSLLRLGDFGAPAPSSGNVSIAPGLNSTLLWRFQDGPASDMIIRVRVFTAICRRIQKRPGPLYSPNLLHNS